MLQHSGCTGPAGRPGRPRVGTGLMGTWLFNGDLVLQGNIHFRAAQFEKLLKLPAREILGTLLAKYPFSRCRIMTTRRPHASCARTRGPCAKRVQ